MDHRLVRRTLTCDQSGMDQASLSRPRLAILIDAENVPPSCWPPAKAIAARFGMAVVVRAYVCHAPSQAWIAAEGVEIVDGRPADGPNAADFLMAMDAAVMAAEGQVDGLVLLTGDDGFAAVAHCLKMRGMNVYALIPFHGGPVSRRLVAMADVAILVPMPLPQPVAPRLSSNDWEAQCHRALAQCKVDDQGWVTLSDLGGALKAAGVKLPSGKLSKLVRESSSIEWQVWQTTIRVRLTNRAPPQDAPWYEHMSVDSGAPGVLQAEDDEIPF